MGSIICKSENNKIVKLKNECGNEESLHHQKQGYYLMKSMCVNTILNNQYNRLCAAEKYK